MITLAALALAGAALTLPASPRRRLAPTRRKPLPRWLVPLVAVLALVLGVGLLSVTTVVASAVVMATLTMRWRRRRHGARGIEESRSMETAIDVLVGELRVGAHPATAFAVAADETTGPVAEACRAVAARARLGADVAAGLRGASATTALPFHWERLAVCWELATDHGLAMSALMRAAQRDIVERQRFSSHVRSAMAGARATAAILAALPVLSVMLGQMIGARPLPFLFGDGFGGWLLVVGLALICAGLLWADRITDRVSA